MINSKNMYQTPKQIADASARMAAWQKSYAFSTGSINDAERIIDGVYQTSNTTSNYEIALFGLSCLATNDIGLAEKVGDCLADIYNKYFYVGKVTGMHRSYNNSRDGVPIYQFFGERWTGNSAFVLMFFNAFQRAVLGTPKENKYKRIADDMARWHVSLQDIPSQQNRYNDGGFYSGYVDSNLSASNTNGLMRFKVSEANIDTIGALTGHARYYGGAYMPNVDLAINYLLFDTVNGVFEPTTGRVRGGKNDGADAPSNPATYPGDFHADAAAWGGLAVYTSSAFEKIMSEVYPASVRDLRAYNLKPFNNQNIRVDAWKPEKLVDPNSTIIVAANAWYALLYYKAYLYELKRGNIEKAKEWLELRKIEVDALVAQQRPSVRYPNTGGVSSFYHNRGVFNENTSWGIMALNAFNPFDPGWSDLI